MLNDPWWAQPKVIRERLVFIRRGGETTRFHTVPTIKQETVGHHSFGVAWFCWLLAPNNEPSRDLLLAAMAHDLAEWKVGDIPAPSKRRLDIRAQVQALENGYLVALRLPMAKLSEEDKRILGFADIFDGLMSCLRERQMGNQVIHEAWVNFSRYLLQEMGVLTSTIEGRVWLEIEQMYKECCE